MFHHLRAVRSLVSIVMLVCQADAVQLLLRYVLEMARFDEDYDLRDRARFLRRLVLAGPSDALNLQAKASEILLAPKPPPVPIRSGTAGRVATQTPTSDGVTTCTLSLVVGHSAPGYLPLPAFPTVKPPSKVRDVSENQETEGILLGR
jgi:AP-3 complex subunit beta